MSPKATLSYSAAVILQAIASGYRYGFDVMDITGLPSGTVYPALRRMEDAGLVDSRWESEGVAQRDGRPLRKYYEISAAGREALAEALKRYRYMERLLPIAAGREKPATEPEG
ncbi:MAG TPA: PadR family transcriptional regulator [Pyrinomonadaceae bacterium]|nr:PadR family transcriptional regulator [Pyrinomonadaceae bacterium]